MKCGHCKRQDEGVTVEHVRLCAPTAEHDREALSRYCVEHDTYKPCSHSEKPARTPVTEAGLYRFEGEIYKVQKAVHGSGHLYAKHLVVSNAGDPGDPDTTVGFAFAPGMIRKLAAQDRMSIEDAKEFGALYGTCCVCGRTLTNESSIEAGIGPICAGRI